MTPAEEAEASRLEEARRGLGKRRPSSPALDKKRQTGGGSFRRLGRRSSQSAVYTPEHTAALGLRPRDSGFPG